MEWSLEPFPSIIFLDFDMPVAVAAEVTATADRSLAPVLNILMFLMNFHPEAILKLSYSICPDSLFTKSDIADRRKCNILENPVCMPFLPDWSDIMGIFLTNFNWN